MSDAARVLVVDDTPANVKLLVDLLTFKGYATSSAVDGEQALAMIPAEMPDLVLLDIMMPGLSGYEVCKRLRADPVAARAGVRGRDARGHQLRARQSADPEPSVP